MLGIMLIALGEIFAETSATIGRYEVKHRKETLYAMGFLSGFWATIFLILYGLVWGEFRFSLESLPTFGLRLVLETMLIFFTLHATITADRSTFAFLRTFTIPLLLVADIALGYSLSLNEILGVSCIVIALIILLLNHGLSRRGKLLSLLSALTAVGTLTLYKYNITYFNSVEAEQTLTHVLLLLIIAVVAKWHTGENVAHHLFRPIFFIQSLLAGVASVLFSFAFLFAPTSVITAVKRSLEILGAIVSGRTYFHEKHVVVKSIAFLFIAAGIVFAIL
jgi:drug/metabolite transporter (DMT)-like permease